MAWPTTTIADYLSGTGAKVLGRDMYDRAVAAKGAGSSFWFAAVTETGSSYVDKATLRWRVPEYSRSGDKIRLTIWGKQTGGGTGSYRARETGAPTNGTEVSTTTSADALMTSEITIPDNTWAGVVKTFAVQLKTAGAGTMNGRGTNLMASLMVLPA